MQAPIITVIESKKTWVILIPRAVPILHHHLYSHVANGGASVENQVLVVPAAVFTFLTTVTHLWSSSEVASVW